MYSKKSSYSLGLSFTIQASSYLETFAERDHFRGRKHHHHCLTCLPFWSLASGTLGSQQGPHHFTQVPTPMQAPGMPSASHTVHKSNKHLKLWPSEGCLSPLSPSLATFPSSCPFIFPPTHQVPFSLNDSFSMTVPYSFGGFIFYF